MFVFGPYVNFDLSQGVAWPKKPITKTIVEMISSNLSHLPIDDTAIVA